jgi:hypothetical protein
MLLIWRLSHESCKGLVDFNEFNGPLSILRSFAGLGNNCIFGDGLTPAPVGSNNACAAGPCPMGDGLYCGGNMIGGDTSTLYRCTGGSLSVAQKCTSGCRYMPIGQDDQCN